jgi:hypothetical protein
MSTVHGLDILLRVPVMFDEDDGIGSSQVETQSTNASG